MTCEDNPIPCESCGQDAKEATFEGRWLCDDCLYLAEQDSFESRSDRALDRAYAGRE